MFEYFHSGFKNVTLLLMQ